MSRIISPADVQYVNLLKSIMKTGRTVNSRHHETLSVFCPASMTFDSLPIITLRKTHYKKAIKELIWFITGDPSCPKDLADTWWANQLDRNGKYQLGYPHQLRHQNGSFDQYQYVIDELAKNPASRRAIYHLWNSSDMAQIQQANDNLRTPTTCHQSIVQLQIEGNKLNGFFFQRSADVLLGLPHNLVQAYVMLDIISRNVSTLIMGDITPGRITYQIGDAHIYKEDSHIKAAAALCNFDLENCHEVEFRLKLDKEGYKIDNIPDPIYQDKVNLIA